MNLVLCALLQGIAAGYPGDEGLEKDPRVLFVDDFETGTIEEIGRRWGHVAHAKNMSLVPEIAPGSPGRRSLHIAKNGHLYTHVTGVDLLHARFYVRFHPRSGYVHHFVHLNAHRTPKPMPLGTAGIRPSGEESFSTGIEPWGEWGKYPAPGIWHFYSYWHEMKGGRDGKYWGNHFEAKDPKPIEPGRWYCIEAMLKANSAPDKADGAHAFWVDGAPVASFEGIRWRTSDEVKINTFWLLYYVTEQAARHNRDARTDFVDEVWFDDVVLATAYIGPVQGTPAAGKKAATPGIDALQRPVLADLSGKLLKAWDFSESPAPFKGELKDGALCLPPKGGAAWNAWSVVAGPKTVVRLLLKPEGAVDEVTIQIWSDRLKDNVRHRVTGLKPGAWREVAVNVSGLRAGWGADGGFFGGSTFDNLQIHFQGAPDARLLVDGLEIRE